MSKVGNGYCAALSDKEAWRAVCPVNGHSAHDWRVLAFVRHFFVSFQEVPLVLTRMPVAIYSHFLVDAPSTVWAGSR